MLKIAGGIVLGVSALYLIDALGYAIYGTDDWLKVIFY